MANSAATTLTITLPHALLQQATSWAGALDITREELITRALAHFITNQQTPPSSEIDHRHINQGDIYWIQLDDVGAGITHPYVVVQDNLFNHSRIATVVVCALTSNLRRHGETPGNVLLDAGEGNLPKQSVVEVSKISSVSKAQLGAQIGTLSAARVTEILAGLRFLQATAFSR